jgi:hypothetical protein
MTEVSSTEGKESIAKSKMFSPEQHASLERLGYKFFTLTGTGESIRIKRTIIDSLRGKAKRKHPDFNTLKSMNSQVAINPEKFFLSESGDKTFEEQENMVKKFEEEIKKEVPGVKAVIGQPPDYLEIISLYGNTDKLMGGMREFSLIRTTPVTTYDDLPYQFDTPLGPVIGKDGVENVKNIHNWRGEDKAPNLKVAPLVVPA